MNPDSHRGRRQDSDSREKSNSRPRLKAGTRDLPEKSARREEMET